MQETNTEHTILIPKKMIIQASLYTAPNKEWHSARLEISKKRQFQMKTSLKWSRRRLLAAATQKIYLAVEEEMSVRASVYSYDSPFDCQAGTNMAIYVEDHARIIPIGFHLNLPNKDMSFKAYLYLSACGHLFHHQTNLSYFHK